MSQNTLNNELHRRGQRGQIILMVTLALFAMCGLMALAIDLGWSYFVKKAAQGAADSAAISAVAAGMNLAIGNPPYSCGAGNPALLDCTSGGAPVACSSIANTSNLYKACQYAQSNGFVHGVNNTAVTVAANVCSGGIGCPGGGTQPPTVPNVAVSYWVTVRVTQTVPQLFAAMAGNPNATISSRATAAITRVVFNASITLLNRQNDPIQDGNNTLTGINLRQQGGGEIQAPGGMLLSSNIAGAATQGGGASVTNTPFSYFRGGGTCVPNGNGPCNWVQMWTNGRADGATFQDPTSLGGGLGQPPLQSGGTDRAVPVTGSGGNERAVLGPGVPGVTGSGTQADPYVVPPGNYYACVNSNGSCVPNGMQLTFDNNRYYRFQGNGGNANLDQYVFYGGLRTNSGATNITFTPGAYVFAGTTNNNPAFEVDNSTVLRDTNTGNGSYAGEIFIYTAPTSTYGSTLSVPAAITQAGVQFQFSESGIKSGQCRDCIINLTGLNASSAPTAFQPWAPFLMWQDRGNSYVSYNPNNGTINGDGGGNCAAGTMGAGAVSLDNPCRSAVPLSSTSPRMYLQAVPNANMAGAVYQPRGAWLSMQGGSRITGQLRIVTGAIVAEAGSSILLSGIGAPITVNTTALIE